MKRSQTKVFMKDSFIMGLKVVKVFINSRMVASMRGSSKKMIIMGSVSLPGVTIRCMKVIGFTTRCMDKALLLGLTEGIIKVIILTTKNMDKANSSGPTKMTHPRAGLTTDHGKEESNMELGSLPMQMVNKDQVNGIMVKS